MKTWEMIVIADNINSLNQIGINAQVATSFLLADFSNYISTPSGINANYLMTSENYSFEAYCLTSNSYNIVHKFPFKASEKADPIQITLLVNCFNSVVKSFRVDGLEMAEYFDPDSVHALFHYVNKVIRWLNKDSTGELLLSLP